LVSINETWSTARFLHRVHSAKQPCAFGLACIALINSVTQIEKDCGRVFLLGAGQNVSINSEQIADDSHRDASLLVAFCPKEAVAFDFQQQFGLRTAAAVIDYLGDYRCQACPRAERLSADTTPNIGDDLLCPICSPRA